MPIGERIQQVRGRLSRKKFSELIGIVENTLRNYEQGLSLPNSDVIAEICNKTDTSLDWLIFGAEGNETGNVESIPCDSNSPSLQAGCKQCLALYAKLETANERIYLASEEAKTLLKENGELKALSKENEYLAKEIDKLKAELAELKNKQFTSEDSPSPMASAS